MSAWYGLARASRSDVIYHTLLELDQLKGLVEKVDVLREVSIDIFPGRRVGSRSKVVVGGTLVEGKGFLESRDERWDCQQVATWRLTHGLGDETFVLKA
ncbi:hypothetical protein L7F22_021806, partial [Adiantum nelumboides]|nr:hypothetical protein [Adiantum nelumboides]